jgi:hypothetical protein
MDCQNTLFTILLPLQVWLFKRMSSNTHCL